MRSALRSSSLVSFAVALACSSEAGIAPPPTGAAGVSAGSTPVQGVAPNPTTAGPSATQNPTPTSVGSAPGSPQLISEGEPTLIVDAPTVPPAPGEEDCDNILEVTYRDFSEAHEDFEMEFSGDVVRLQMVEPTLGEDGTPTFLDSLGCPPDKLDPTICGDWDVTQVSINSADSFHAWYHTTEGVNVEFQKEMELTETAAGSGVYVFESMSFFPLGPEEGFGVTPVNAGQGKNFLFTTEMHLLFTYVAGQTFSFSGDDDLWIFVNNTLALDLGSMHRAEVGEIDFDAQAEKLGIKPNGVYPMDVFHAERHTSASNFRIETNIGCFRPQPPRIVR
jgi:fibro-slime domain-containing protein